MLEADFMAGVLDQALTVTTECQAKALCDHRKTTTETSQIPVPCARNRE